jgi:hypothetical protein
MAPLSTIDMNAYAVADGHDQVCASVLKSSRLALHASSLRRVSFAVENTTHHVLHINDYSPEEKYSSWYCKEDIKAIKDVTKEVVSKMVQDEIENDAYCFRGLEARTIAGARRKRQNKIDARAAVFFEQEMQEEDGICDPEAIADVYYDYSEHCQVEAQMKGLRDKRAALEALTSSKLIDIALNIQSNERLNFVSGSAAA